MSLDQSIAKTLPWWPFKIRRDFVVNVGNESSFSATVVTRRKEKKSLIKEKLYLTYVLYH